MQYMLLIYDVEATWERMSEAEKGKMYGEYMQFSKEMRESKKMVSGDALQPVSTATCVRIRDGKTARTHGPFAETREQLGGYYLIEANDLDEACAIAAKIPSARIGTIEVRPVMTFD